MHNIHRDRFIARGTPGWHRIGEVFPEDERIEVEEAFARKLDMSIVKVPLTATLPDGSTLIVDDTMALARLAQGDDPASILSIVHRDYPYFTNQEIGRMVGDLSRAANWPLETAGLLGKGESLFVTLRAGKHLVAGKDEIHDFFLFSDNRNGKAPAEIAYVPRRVVCQNTLNWALDEASTRVSIRHNHQTFRSDVTWTLDIVARLRGVQLQSWERFDAMAARRLTAEERGAIFAATYPVAGQPEQMALVRQAEAAGHNVADLLARHADKMRDWEYRRDQQLAFRADAEQLYDRLVPEFDRDGLAGSAWHVYNVVTEAEDTRVGTGTSDAAIAKSAESAVFGTRAKNKERAFAELAKLL